MQLKDLDRNVYFYILSFLCIQDLGRLAKTDWHNRVLSQHDNVWRPIFLRDYHTVTFYKGHRRLEIKQHFKAAYRDTLPLLPLVQATDFRELARQMLLLSHLFPPIVYQNKKQVRRVWYGSSDIGESITRQYGVRNTYMRIKSECRSDKEADKRIAKKARTALNTSKEHALTQENEGNELFNCLFKK